MQGYSDETLVSIREQLEQITDHDFYANYFEEAGTSPKHIDSWADFRSLPFTSAEDFLKNYETYGPEASFDTPGAMLSFTPTGENLLPVFDAASDLEHQNTVHENVFEKIGIEPGDRVLNTFGYHLFGTGILLHRGLESLGAEVVPLGPGNSEQAANMIETYDVDVLVGNPSYALKIGKHDVSVDMFIGGGEPFTSIPGLRSTVKDSLGCETAVDYFGTRRASPVAVECEGENGLHIVDNNVLLEIIDPDTGEVLSPGDRGELVITHLNKFGSPLVRFRTGDLSELRREKCSTCGSSLTLPEGVIGRTDNRLKVKGVKIYPESIETVLAGIDGLSGQYRVEVSRPESTDHLKIICENEDDVPLEDLRKKLESRLLIAPDEVTLTRELEGETGTVDHRY